MRSHALHTFSRFTCLYLAVHVCVFASIQRLKEGVGSPEVTGSCEPVNTGLGTKPKSSARTANGLNYWALL